MLFRWLCRWPLGVVSCWLLCPFSGTGTFIFLNTFWFSSMTRFSRLIFCSLGPAQKSAASKGLCWDLRSGLCLLSDAQVPTKRASSQSPCVRADCATTAQHPVVLAFSSLPSPSLFLALVRGCVYLSACSVSRSASPQPTRGTSLLPCQGSHKLALAVVLLCVTDACP